MITEKLIAQLREHFPDRKVTFGAPPQPSAVFAAAHPEVGDLEIYDDGDEATIVFQIGGHHHFSPPASKSIDEMEREIVEDVVQFLTRLFANRIVIWWGPTRQSGWVFREKLADKSFKRPNAPLYVWSGPLIGE
jgi:hypothetical protein